MPLLPANRVSVLQTEGRDELQAGVSILRYPQPGPDPGSSSTQDDYVIQVLQSQEYSFELLGGDLPAGTQVTVTDASGQSMQLLSTADRISAALGYRCDDELTRSR